METKIKCAKCGNTEKNKEGVCVYCIWKGNAGPGLQLKKMIKAEQSE